MGKFGMIRHFDVLGRIVIPKTIRAALNIEKDDSVEMIMEDDVIMIKKHVPFCFFCKSEKNIKPYKGKNVCKNCVREIINEAKWWE